MSKLTHEQFCEKLKIVEPNIDVLSNYKGSLNPIRVKCKACGHEWTACRAHELIRKNKSAKCPICHCEGIDRTRPELLANKYPKIAEWLYDKEDGYKYTYGSKQKVDWICPDCGNIVKDIPISKVSSRKHVPCKKCSDGISYPNKLMFNLLNIIGDDFEVEYQPDWIKPKRFDFFIPSKMKIIEMDGAIGHGRKSFDGKNIEYGADIDHYKELEAKKRGIDVIRIDAYYSDINYISNNILNSELADIYDLTNIDWAYLDLESLSSMNRKVADLWNEYHDMGVLMSKTKLSRTTLNRYLNRATNLGLCEYDAKEQLILSGKRNISKAHEKTKVPVKCMETGQTFESFCEANKWLGYAESSHVIRDYLNGILQSAGKHPITKQSLHWEYVNKESMGVI